MCFAESGVIIIIYSLVSLESADLKCVAVVLEGCLVFAFQINDNASDNQQNFEPHCSKRQLERIFIAIKALNFRCTSF